MVVVVVVVVVSSQQQQLLAQTSPIQFEKKPDAGMHFSTIGQAQMGQRKVVFQHLEKGPGTNQRSRCVGFRGRVIVILRGIVKVNKFQSFELRWTAAAAAAAAAVIVVVG